MISHISLSALVLQICHFVLAQDSCKPRDCIDLKCYGLSKAIHVNPERSFGGTNGSHRAKRANFGRGVRAFSPGKFQKPTFKQYVNWLLHLAASLCVVLYSSVAVNTMVAVLTLLAGVAALKNKQSLATAAARVIYRPMASVALIYNTVYL